MNMTVDTKTRRSGEARRDQVISAARELFLTKGFDQTSIKDITDIAGGSRRDIYDRFTDKEGLFEAVLQTLITEIVSPAEMTFPLRPGEDVANDLRVFSLALLGNMLEPSSIKIFRQFVSIGAARPEIGRQAYQSGPGVLYRRLAEYFAVCARDGRLQIDNPDRTARIFVEMLKGDYQLRALMTNETTFDRTELADHVDNVVSLFLKGAAPRG
jgi:TetR/AcrR family transcriptional regulator, mexJK operon transcriptional repressor